MKRSSSVGGLREASQSRKHTRHWSVMVLAIAFLLTACGGAAAPTATPDPLSGTVSLTQPLPTTTIYSSVMVVNGSVEGTAGNDLLVRLVAPEGEVLTEGRINSPSQTWGIELVHGYEGDPIPVMVEVRPASEPNAGVLASTQVTLAAQVHRPEGVYADILAPTDGDTVGGDVIVVEGRSSGVTEPFTVELLSDNDTILDTQRVTPGSAFPLDDAPWMAELLTDGYTGNAVIVATFADGLEQRIAVVVTGAAG